MTNYPVPFHGTKEQAEANYDTHSWFSTEDEVRCMECDAKPIHQVASYPCGSEPKRIECEPEVYSQIVRNSVIVRRHLSEIEKKLSLLGCD